MDILTFSMRAPNKYVDRQIDEEKHNIRSDFMRDRDRIMYCKLLEDYRQRLKCLKSVMMTMHVTD